MILYKFKTRSTYFFPPIKKTGKFIYSLYGNYGGKATKLYWWLFTHISLFRFLFKTKTTKIENYQDISSLLGDDCIYGINYGTPGPEQKKSIIGYNKKTGKTFFAKFATKEPAKILTKNEIKVYKTLEGSGLVPKLYDYSINDNYVFLNCECIIGQHVKEYLKDDVVLEILNKLRNYHYDKSKVIEYKGQRLLTCFAHNDFCLWNMINKEEKIYLIDWEMANEYPLGHDLFTYIFQVSFFIWNSTPTSIVLKNNTPLIKKYFGDIDYTPYINSFVDYKISFFSNNQNQYALKRYKELKELI